MRSEAADALLAEPGRTRLLVAALERGEVQTWTLNFGQKRDLIMNDDPEIRALARPLLEQAPEEREKVLKRYEAALDREGDPRRGREVFDRVCAKCHRLDGKGAEVGPDLGSIRNRAPSLLLADILLPSRAIAQNYESYVVETASGDVLEGIIASQTPERDRPPARGRRGTRGAPIGDPEDVRLEPVGHARRPRAAGGRGSRWPTCSLC